MLQCLVFAYQMRERDTFGESIQILEKVIQKSGMTSILGITQLGWAPDVCVCGEFLIIRGYSAYWQFLMCTPSCTR